MLRAGRTGQLSSSTPRCRAAPGFEVWPVRSGAGVGHAEYRTTRDGRTALLVYSALDRLHTCRGSDQPWFVLPTAKLQVLYDVRPFDLVLLDVVVPEDVRREAAR